VDNDRRSTAAIAYARVSTREGASGHGISAQLSATRLYAIAAMANNMAIGMRRELRLSWKKSGALAVAYVVGCRATGYDIIRCTKICSTAHLAPRSKNLITHLAPRSKNLITHRVILSKTRSKRIKRGCQV